MPVITYVGAVIPSKGFHVLAKQWPKILKKFPNAKLNVIGTGNLYAGNGKLGELELAEESYEKLFRKYITNSDGKLIDSVILHGIIGQEKKTELLVQTSIGIINPTARTENCPVSAIDFQAHGVPVITKYKNGSVDILLNNKTGKFFLFEKSMHKKISYLLKNISENKKFGNEAIVFFENRFSTNKILEKWEDHFNLIEANRPIDYKKPNGHYFNNQKFIRIAIRFIRMQLGFKSFPSLIKIESIVKHKLSSVIKG